jgi:rare lipoprotein A
MHALTAAHPSLPFGTRVKVTNALTGANVEVRINDRGPFAHRRIIDLSPAAARSIGLIQLGVGPVILEPLTFTAEMLSSKAAYGADTPTIGNPSKVRLSNLNLSATRFSR